MPPRWYSWNWWRINLARYKFVLAYDGTGYCGFQKQKNALTVQSVVEEALRTLGWSGQSLLSAGRTDTGVHASGQVCCVDLEWAHSPVDLLQALNARLPAAVAVRSAERVAPDFHPRYWAQSRRYQYRIFCDARRHPLKERFAWRVWPEVSYALLEACSEELVGVHDFSAFGTPSRRGGNTVRQILDACWRSDGLDLIFEVVGNAFLYRMVRRLVSFQVEVGQGKRELDQVNSILDRAGQAPIEGLAPACGLTLVEVTYPPHVDGDVE